MREKLGPFLSQPRVAVLTAAVASVVLAHEWLAPLAAGRALATVTSPWLTAVLVIALILTYEYPIHIKTSLKVYVGSVALFLIATLLSPPVAMIAAAVGVAAGNVVSRAESGVYPSDIITDASRYSIVVVVGSLVAHLPSLGPQLESGWPAVSTALLCVTALVLWAGDILTIPLVVCPISREAPVRVAMSFAREAALVEGAQYLIGLLGALVIREQGWTTLLLFLPTVLIYLSFKSAKEMRDSTREILESMADTVDLRDPYTGGHSRRVATFARQTLDALSIRGPEADLIVAAARVHDIGKIGVPDHVLNKPGKLEPEEWALMQRHPELGADLLKRYPDFARGVDVVRHHHEAWDGSGYPHRLKGTEIPFGARIIAVADTYDAMTSDRPYRKGMSIDKAASILRDGRGKQWEGRIVDAFLLSIADQLAEPVALLRLVPDQRQEVTAG